MVSDKEVMEAASRSMECSVKRMHGRFRRGLNALATIGSTAPFVGLFGTVIGIMNSFRGAAMERATYIGMVSGGIAEALVTTGLGLLVAVPAVWAFNYFSHNSKRLIWKWINPWMPSRRISADIRRCDETGRYARRGVRQARSAHAQRTAGKCETALSSVVGQERSAFRPDIFPLAIG